MLFEFTLLTHVNAHLVCGKLLWRRHACRVSLLQAYNTVKQRQSVHITAPVSLEDGMHGRYDAEHLTRLSICNLHRQFDSQAPTFGACMQTALCWLQLSCEPCDRNVIASACMQELYGN